MTDFPLVLLSAVESYRPPDRKGPKLELEGWVEMEGNDFFSSVPSWCPPRAEQVEAPTEARPQIEEVDPTLPPMASSASAPRPPKILFAGDQVRPAGAESSPEEELQEFNLYTTGEADFNSPESLLPVASGRDDPTELPLPEE